MRKAFLAILSLGAMMMMYGETTWLRITSGGTTKEVSYTRTETERDGLRLIEEKSERGMSLYAVRPDGEAERFEFTDKDGNCRMTRDGPVVSVSGFYKGKQINAEVKLGKAGWFGSFDQALKYLSSSGKKEVTAMLINPGDPSKAMEMKYTVLGDEKLGELPAHKIKVGLTGILANFWSAYYWIDDAGTTIRYEGDNGPGTPKMIVEYLRSE